MKRCIGIISYFPDNIKRERISYLERFLLKINSVFPGIDVIIVAQNWGSYLPDLGVNFKLTIYKYPGRLGIIRARKALRKHFLQNNYDTCIMADDDCELIGDDWSSYIEDMDNNPDKLGLFKRIEEGFNFKLIAIPRYMLEETDIPYVDCEKAEGYDDVIYSPMMTTKYPDKWFYFRKINGIDETSRIKGARTWCDNRWKENYAAADKLIKEYQQFGTIKGIKY